MIIIHSPCITNLFFEYLRNFFGSHKIKMLYIVETMDGFVVVYFEL